MVLVPAQSAHAQRAFDLVTRLQQRFATQLTAWSRQPFVPVTWLRDEGRHGGGTRLESPRDAFYNAGSVNVSQVHYDDDASRALASANALSTIIHPRNPLAPSVHIHISFTEMRDGSWYWRMMADLNPAVPYAADTAAFTAALQAAAGATYAHGAAQGDAYFRIPALGRTRGVTHFYLEAYRGADFNTDAALAERVGAAAIDAYTTLLPGAAARIASANDELTQLDYHTLYFFQVLLLDRGTSSGLIVHNQNDIGILGSLPNFIRPSLLAQWEAALPPLQAALLRALCAVLPMEQAVVEVTPARKQALAQALREFCVAHPAVLDLQARADVVPPTVANHQR